MNRSAITLVLLLFLTACGPEKAQEQSVQVPETAPVEADPKKGIAWFDFRSLCDGPRSQTDYIEIARWYPTIILSGVPALDEFHDNQARRFIALVDEFYDRRVKLVLSAEAPVQRLYIGERLAFEFQRTISRLTEMRTPAFLGRPHLG